MSTNPYESPALMAKWLLDTQGNGKLKVDRVVAYLVACEEISTKLGHHDQAEFWRLTREETIHESDRRRNTPNPGTGDAGGGA